MKKIKKGEFGYINNQKKIEILKTLLMLVLCIGTYYLGIATTGSNKNLLTFVAILGVLPMAKFAVIAVLFIKATGCSDKAHSQLQSVNVTAYDLYMTDYKENYSYSAVKYNKECLILFTEDDKLDEARAKEHLDKIISNAGISNITCKIYKNINSFIDRCNELDRLDDVPNPVLIENLLSVSI